MPPILGNDDAERMILDIRARGNAASQEVDDRGGAFLVFPTSVVTPGPIRGLSVYPIRCDTEPGTIVTCDGTAHVSGVIAGVTVTGTFRWALGGDTTPVAGYQFRKGSREVPAPHWARQLPDSQHLTSVEPVTLACQRSRLLRRGRDAERRLLSLTELVIRGYCRGVLRAAVSYRPQIDMDDVVQRGLQVACRLLPLYASKDRPPCSWLGMLKLDGRRDMYREVSRLDWFPGDAMAAVTLADACGVRRQDDPEATLTELVAEAEHLGRPLPRLTASALDVAMRAPALIEYEMAAASAPVPGPYATDDDRGVVAAMVAQLVTTDEKLISLARAGDTQALDRVAVQVVSKLRQRGENQRQTRNRCWEQFQRSGQLFSSEVGIERFGSAADRGQLTAVDGCLRRAAGIRPGRGDS